MLGLEAVVKFDDEGVLNCLANLLLIVDYGLFLIFEDEFLGHHLHGIELAVGQTAYQIHLAKPSDGQAFEDLVLLKCSLFLVPQTLEIDCPVQNSVPKRDAVVEQDVPINRLEANDLGGFESGFGFALGALEVVQLLVEQVLQVFGLNVQGQLHLQLTVLVM